MKTLFSLGLILCFVPAFISSSFAAKTELTLDLDKSGCTWKGKFLGSDLTASMKFKSGMFTVKDHAVSGGTLVADMNSLTSNSLLDAQVKGPMLLDTKTYPTAEFKITEFTEVKAFAPGGPNARVSGKLTFKGKAKPVSAEFVMTPDENGFHVVGKFKTVYGKMVDGEVAYEIWTKKK